MVEASIEASHRQGGCQCGAVRYELSREPEALYACHCRECQKQSASAFGISVIVREEDVRLVQGEPRTWTRPTESGDTLHCAFCRQCGTRLWHRSGRDSGVSIKGGSLDIPVDLSGAMHIWTSRTLAGVCLPEGAVTFPEEPPTPPSPTATGS